MPDLWLKGSDSGLTMLSITQIAQATFVAALVVGGVPSVAISQEQAVKAESQPVVVETFESGDPAKMLGGQIDVIGETAPWFVHVADGKLMMENRLDPRSLHFNDISWVKYPDSDQLASTEDAVISATVEANNAGKGGAGILVGSGKAGAYLMFSVDGQGQYHVLRKDGRNLRPLRSAKHVAIHAGAANQVTFEARGANVVFFANGVEIIKIPVEISTNNAARRNGQGGVGLAAFGTGTFTFDDVEIARAD